MELTNEELKAKLSEAVTLLERWDYQWNRLIGPRIGSNSRMAVESGDTQDWNLKTTQEYNLDKTEMSRERDKISFDGLSKIISTSVVEAFLLCSTDSVEYIRSLES